MQICGHYHRVPFDVEPQPHRPLVTPAFRVDESRWPGPSPLDGFLSEPLLPRRPLQFIVPLPIQRRRQCLLAPYSGAGRVCQTGPDASSRGMALPVVHTRRLKQLFGMKQLACAPMQRLWGRTARWARAV